MSMRTLGNTLKFIWNHPLSSRQRSRALGDYLRWQVGSRLVEGSVAMPFVGDARLLVRPGMVGATGNVYTGLHEFEDMAFVLHALRPDDLFVDVGANVGSYTLIAVAAAHARSITFEPAPETWRGLQDNLHLNGIIDRVTAHHCGVGAEAGSLTFTTGHDVTNHVVSEGEAIEGETVDVPIVPLDEAVGPHDHPFLIKVDVEGFETSVVQGAERVFADEQVAGVLLELTGHGERYGFDEDALHRKMLGFGYAPFRYLPWDRRLERLTHRSRSGNTLYLRRIDDLEARLRTAPRYRVKGVEV